MVLQQNLICRLQLLSGETMSHLLEIVRLFAIAAVKRQQDLTLERRAISVYKNNKNAFKKYKGAGP